MTLSNFFIKVAEKEKWKAQFDTLVAAAASARHGAAQGSSYNERHESELGDEVMIKDCNSKTTFALHNNKHMAEPSASKDTVQPHGLDDVSAPCVIEINPELIKIEEEPELQSKPGNIAPRSSPSESKCMDNIQEIKDPGSCSRSSPIPVEESEESSCSSSATASSDNDDSESSEAPSKSIQHEFDKSNARAIIAHMLEERHCGNLDSVAGLESSVLDKTMGLLRDRVA
jgi:hypothetical protein